MEKWVLANRRADWNKIAEEFKIDPVTAALICNRGIEENEDIYNYLHGGIKDLHDPKLLKDMGKAISLLEATIKQRKKIRIIGDYDIDGVMATYILRCGLIRVGARVDTVIPHRMHDGYGINDEIIKAASKAGIDTIITCDNGIAAKEQISLAKEKGMTVIVTDHHEVPRDAKGQAQILPPADAIINPKQDDCNYPFAGLCGAAVAYKLIIELYRYFNVPDSEHEKLLEYAGFATVGDVMELVDENRIIVRIGLQQLQNTENVGLKQLKTVCGLDEKQITPYHIGFVLGPCINASGRLNTAELALELLNATSVNEATKIANDMKELNDSRKEMTGNYLREAIAAVEESSLINDRVLVVYLPNCHESLAGIIAGNLRKKYCKPAIVLTDGTDCIKGSGRSIENYSMVDELAKCHELIKFGGHQMAAGMSLLSREDVLRFRKTINEQCTLTAEDLIEKIVIDVAMPLSYIRPELIKEFELLQPFGNGNGEPVFAQKNVKFSNPRVFGKNKNVLKARAVDENGAAIDAVFFGENEEFLLKIQNEESMSITYYPTINSYMGRESMQIVVSHYC